MLIPELFHADEEYRQLCADVTAALSRRSLPFAACGMCDGAADAAILSLILGDLLLAKYDPRISLSEEGGGGR